MDRTRSNLTLAALLLAVGYIVGQAVGPRGADAGVSYRPTGEPVVTVADDNPSRIIQWHFSGQGGPRAVVYWLNRDQEGKQTIESTEYTTPPADAPGR